MGNDISIAFRASGRRRREDVGHSSVNALIYGAAFALGGQIVLETLTNGGRGPARDSDSVSQDPGDLALTFNLTVKLPS